MKSEFWHERWKTNQLGFHQEEVNERLLRYWPDLGLRNDAPAFVPLCGKSLDMRWLREAGHPVYGVELSPIACRDFFSEAGLEPAVSRHGALERHEAAGYRIDCGDFFELSANDLAGTVGVFDRGSLVALPEQMRRRYSEHITAILPADVSILLLTVEYEAGEMKGPPHSVPATEIEALFGPAFACDRLWATGPAPPPPHFKNRGLDLFSEVVWHLHRGRPRGGAG